MVPATSDPRARGAGRGGNHGVAGPHRAQITGPASGATSARAGCGRGGEDQADDEGEDDDHGQEHRDREQQADSPPWRPPATEGGPGGRNGSWRRRRTRRRRGPAWSRSGRRQGPYQRARGTPGRRNGARSIRRLGLGHRLRHGRPFRRRLGRRLMRLAHDGCRRTGPGGVALARDEQIRQAELALVPQVDRGGACAHLASMLRDREREPRPGVLAQPQERARILGRVAGGGRPPGRCR